MWHEIIIALCLLVIIEGILPFLSPQLWRKIVVNAAQLSDRNLRIMGLLSMLIGSGILYLVNG
ncbi:MAG: DUF2065 domain-containing protein [Spongiibacteraceae bacterium]